MTRIAIMVALWLVAGAAPATTEAAREARREAADYHAFFEIREITPPAVTRDSGAGRCRTRGIVHIMFRGARDLETGRPVELILPCGAGGDAAPTLYDHTDPGAPRRLIVWLYKFEERLMVGDWVAPGD